MQFALGSLFAAWVKFWGGDDTLCGFLGANAWLGSLGLRPLEDADPDIIRLFVAVLWICSAGFLGIAFALVCLLRV